MKFTLWQKISLTWNIASLAFYCFYCGYFIHNNLGSKVVNYILLASTIVYFLIFVITWIIKGRKGKRFTGATKRVYKVTRKLTLLINTVVTGGAIINMSVFGGRMIIAVCALILIVNLGLNILWLIFLWQMERRHGETIRSIKTEAKQFAGGLKSLFKKGLADGRESSQSDEPDAEPTQSAESGDMPTDDTIQE